MSGSPSGMEQDPASNPGVREAGFDRERKAKTAVVLIHGIGEQRPMETLWGFVDAVWSKDRDLVEAHNSPTYAKPDMVSENIDLRRVTTRYWQGDDPRRVDFFEYYWAHLMRGNSVRSTVDWILSLFIRSPSSVPTGLRRVWLIGLVFVLLAIALFVAAALPQALAELLFERNMTVALAIISSLMGIAAVRWLAPIAGDAARYFSTRPDNVEARHRIINGGAEIIMKLTRSGEYDRIILVGHSLGAAVGIDILRSAFGQVKLEDWVAVHPVGGRAAGALVEVERLAGTLIDGESSPETLTAFRSAQRAYSAELRNGWADGAAPWLVSDFVTLGAPLSKADILLARNKHAFHEITKRRQVPTCPPILELQDPPRFSFRQTGGTMVPHFGAVFGPTQWTNLYFPNYALFFGDIISGPVAPLFGRGVRDVKLPGTGLRFRHLDYWRIDDGPTIPPWIAALRSAVNLRLRHEASLWRDDELVEALSSGGAEVPATAGARQGTGTLTPPSGKAS